MRKRILASSLTLYAVALHAQSYTCPDEPTWSAISCSMHEAIQPTDWDGFDLTFVLERDQYRDYMVTSGPSAVRLRIYRHFDDPDWVAKQLAKAWAGQPRALRRSVMPFLIGIDSAGPIYRDFTDTPEARHIVEYPAEYVHEYASTLNWAFEELLTHEMCHVIDKQGELRGSGRFSNHEDWRKVADADNDYVSEHARSGGNVEDFAESCAAHILLGTEARLTDAHRDHIKDTMPNRSAYFAKLFTAAYASDGRVAVLTDPVTVEAGAAAPAYTIDTVAGTNESRDGHPATESWLVEPESLAFDSLGNLFIADGRDNRVRKVDAATGVIETVVGTGEAGFSGDGGPATEAQINRPSAVRVDSVGNVFVADTGNRRIRKIDVSTGIITTVVGPDEYESGGDGESAVNAQLRWLVDIAVDSEGNLFVVDRFDHRVHRVDATSGVIDTFAGTGERGYAGDGGPAPNAQLSFPRGVALDARGNVYIADEANNRVRKVDPAGIITTVAGTGARGSSGDGGPAAKAQLSGPTAVAVDADGNLYINTYRHVRQVNPAGIIRTISDNNTGGRSIGIDRNGDLYLESPTSSGVIVKIDSASGVSAPIAGGGDPDASAALQSKIASPHDVEVDSEGNLYLVDSLYQRIRRIDATGAISTVAGTGERGYSGDGGPAAAARLAVPRGVAVDAEGNIYIADTSNHAVRRVDAAAGTITTVAGTGEGDYSGDDGPAAAAQLNMPFGVTIDSVGNIFIADTLNDRVRKVDVDTGIITTLAGNGELGLSGDGGPAVKASLGLPFGVAVDAGGNVYIVGYGTVRKVDTLGIIATIAGMEDGILLDLLTGIAVDDACNVYITEEPRGRVHRLIPGPIITAGTCSVAPDVGE